MLRLTTSVKVCFGWLTERPARVEKTGKLADLGVIFGVADHKLVSS
jgi:hypothetical protein